MSADAATRRGPCEEHELALAELVDGTLDPAEATVLSGHLDGCASCREFLEALRTMDHSLAAALTTAQLPPDFDARLREQIGRIARATSRDVALARAENDYRSTLRRLEQGRGWRAALEGVATAALVAGVWLGLGDAALARLPEVAPAGAPRPMVGLVVAALAVGAGAVATRLMQRTRG